jgi:predicted glycosyltransferase
MVGGGQDGADVVRSAAAAPLPAGHNMVILTGPFMPEPVRRELDARAEADSRFRVIDFLPEPTMLLQRAERVIVMGGYNTVSEVLSFGKNALIIPRVRPRQEQLIRAERLKSLGLAEMTHPDSLTPEALGRWLAADSPSPGKKWQGLDTGGLDRLPQLTAEMLGTPLTSNTNSIIGER